jgi:hypothetical protein
MPSYDIGTLSKPPIILIISSITSLRDLMASTKVLPRLKIAQVIGKAVWDQRIDIRDVITIGKSVRKSAGPEEVERILRTMAKV